MANLLRNTEGVILDNIESNTIFVNGIIGSYGREDYIKMGAFEAFLQDFTQSTEVVDFVVPPTFGLKNTNNADYVTIEISY